MIKAAACALKMRGYEKLRKIEAEGHESDKAEAEEALPPHRRVTNFTKEQRLNVKPKSNCF
jgi:hypothetical protein